MEIHASGKRHPNPENDKSHRGSDREIVSGADTNRGASGRRRRRESREKEGQRRCELVGEEKDGESEEEEMSRDVVAPVQTRADAERRYSERLGSTEETQKGRIGEEFGVRSRCDITLDCAKFGRNGDDIERIRRTRGRRELDNTFASRVSDKPIE